MDNRRACSKMRRELSAVGQFSQRMAVARSGLISAWAGAAGPAPREPRRSDFFHLNDSLALVRPAVETRIVRELQFVTLGTHRHAWRGDAQLLCASLIASGAGMLMFRIGHEFFLQQPVIGNRRDPIG